MTKHQRKVRRVTRHRVCESNRRAGQMLAEIKALWQSGHEAMNRIKSRHRMALQGVGTA